MAEHPAVWLDLPNGCLSHGEKRNMLRPKTLAVLRYLMDRMGQVVTAAELQSAIWPGIKVSSGALRNCILELRQALADPVHAPQYIDTLRRRGYRLLKAIPATLEPGQGRESGVQEPGLSRTEVQGLIKQNTRHQFTTHPRAPRAHAGNLVGREAELEHLHRRLAVALAGERQVIFVTGEPGIGKTAVVETFIQQVAAQPGLWIAQGHSIEHRGAGEAYLPVLEALGRLGQEPGCEERLVKVLGRYAPNWLAELPGLLSSYEREQLHREMVSITRERMLRELADALDALTSEIPLVLVLEDLHWSDPFTLDMLFFLARRRTPARVMVVGTYRPVEVLSQEHPLRNIKQELEMHGHCQEVTLGPWDEAMVGEYLAERFGGSELLDRLARVVYQRTEGNPLFLAKVVDELISKEVITQTGGQWTLQNGIETIATGVPESIIRLVEKQIDQLEPAERRVVEAASVAGMEFSAEAIAVGLGQEVPHIEDLSERLARCHCFFQARGRDLVLNRRKAARYGFIHSFHRDVVYAQLTVGQRVALHQHIGAWKEQVFGRRVRAFAAELAVHFEQGQDYQKALQYRLQAAQIAVKHHRIREAVRHLERGLEILKTLPNTPECIQQGLILRATLEPLLAMTNGCANTDVYTRVQELCRLIAVGGHGIIDVLD